MAMDSDIYDGLREIADAIREHSREVAGVANAIKLLGNANAATPMGALEAHGHRVGEALDGVASALGDIASAVADRA